MKSRRLTGHSRIQHFPENYPEKESGEGRIHEIQVAALFPLWLLGMGYDHVTAEHVMAGVENI